jgi:vitamin B12 transporter
MSKSLPKASLSVAIAFALNTTTSLAHAQAALALLDPLVVTAAKTEQKLSQVPARLTVIKQSEIEQNPSLNLSELLNKQAALTISQYGGIGQGTQLYLRGSNANHTLLLKDGARLNTSNSLSPIYPEVLDLSDIQRIEIVKGPASVQYGSDAIGGVIQLLSQTPTRNTAFVTAQYGENNSYKTILGADAVLASGFYAQLRGQRQETDGTSIFNTQNKGLKAGFDQKGYSAKFGYDDRTRLKAAVEISRNQGNNQYSEDSGLSNAALRQFENQLISVHASAKVLPQLTVNARYSNFQDQQHYLASSPYHADTTRNEGDLNAKWQLNAQHNILAGVSLDQQEYQNAALRHTKQQIDSIGYYLQHQYQSEKINTQLGLRVEDNDNFSTHTVGQGAIRYHLSPKTSIYANIGSAFRAPSLSELYYFSEASYFGSIYQTYGNPDLKPEQSTSYELGIDHQLTPALSLSLSAYKTDIKNLISTTSSYTAATNTTTSTYENINQANMRGGEIGVKWAQDHLYLSSEYAYVKTENEQTKREIAYRPRHSFSLSAGYDDGTYGVNTSVVAHSTANAQNSANSVKVAGHATVDLHAFWNVNPNLKLFSNIQNIGDVRYPTVYNFSNW